MDIETNNPDMLSIFVLKDVNTEKEHRRFVLEVWLSSVFSVFFFFIFVGKNFALWFLKFSS